MSSTQRISVGAIVRVVELPPFLKTADPMPMLRSAQLIEINETGRILEQRPAGYYSVQFANGTFLIDHKYLAQVSDTRSGTQ